MNEEQKRLVRASFAQVWPIADTALEKGVLYVGRLDALPRCLTFAQGLAQAKTLDELARRHRAVDLRGPDVGEQLHDPLVDAGCLERTPTDLDLLDLHAAALDAREPDRRIEGAEGGLGCRLLGAPPLAELVKLLPGQA